jgi:FlaA1/EpsC-like NDP-sugar epimerase
MNVLITGATGLIGNAIEGVRRTIAFLRTEKLLA